MFGWYSIVPNNFWGWKKKQKPFLHLSLSKAGPFTLGNHICIFQGGTPWVAELLNNMNVWMVLYCAQHLLGLKKNKTLESKLKSIESKLKSIESKLNWK